MRSASCLWAVLGMSGWLASGLAGWAQEAAPAADATASWVVARRTLPGGAPGGSVIDLEQTLPREIRQGQPFDYRLRVANCADCPVTEVAVVQRLPPGTRLIGSAPQAEFRDGVATWRLGTMAVRESRLIQARAITDQGGPLTFCCDTLYQAPLCVSIMSTRPELLLGLEMPVEGTPCDAFPVQVTVRNTGTGPCRDVRLQLQLAEGMAGTDGSRLYTYQIGTLPAGEMRRSQIMARAATVGRFQTRAVAVCADGLRSDAVAETRVVAPRLTVVQTGPEQQYAGRDVVYEFSVRNDGDAPAHNLEVDDIIPAGARVVSVKPEAVAVANAGRVVWRLAALPPGGTVDFALTVRADVAGAVANQVTARADCAEVAAARRAVDIQGIAAILLEVVDVDDPIEVGGQETYAITATNQGTAACTNLVVRCVLEDNVQYASSEGPTPGTHTGQEVLFAPLAQLEPKATAVWKVICGAVTPGDVRFRVLLTSDQLTRPVEETESTRLY